MKKVLFIMLITLMSCNSGFDNQEMDEPVQTEMVPQDEIITTIETNIIKKVYVNESDYTGYDIHATEGVSYWYVQYENKDVQGYDILEISKPYLDIAEVHNKLKHKLQRPEQYTQINFIHRVTVDSYIAYHEYEKN